MRMIPSVPISPTNSNAEQRVFQAFEQAKLSSHSTCLHSLRLAQHEYKREGELDFVLVSPQGIYAFEVKGGGVSRNQDGIWLFRDRFGNVHRKSEGPFNQARSGIYSLLDRLKEQFGETEIRQLHFGYGVIFPDCKFDIETIEWPQQIVLDARNFEIGPKFDKYLSGVIQYWQEKAPQYGGAPLPLIEQIIGFLRPAFDRVPNLYQRASQIDEHLESLTEEQYSRLDVAEDNDRILCSGGAGTGKTFLAAELARRHAARGESVLFACRSQQLANHLKTQVQSPLVIITTVHELLSLKSQGFPKCQVLVVDEAQDMMTMQNLDIMDELLAGGLASGTWRFFYDANNQVTSPDCYEPDALEYLESFAPTRIHLKRNCRNTHNIVVQTKLLTAADLGSPSAGEGPPVRYQYYNSRSEASAILAAELSSLLAEDIHPRQVTILSPVSYENSSAQLLPVNLRSKIKNLIREAQPQLTVNCFAYCDIESFKGLENQFVIVTDLEWKNVEDRLVQNQLYVAMSRARTELIMILNNETMKHLAPIMIENRRKLGGDTRAR